MKNLLAVDLKANFFQNKPGAEKLGSSPGSLVSNLLPNILIVAGVIFFGLIIYSGYNLLFLSGNPDQKSAAKAKDTMRYGVAGFLIVVSAYFILQIISSTLGVNFMEPPPSL